jgi:hypothetical protein
MSQSQGNEQFRHVRLEQTLTRATSFLMKHALRSIEMFFWPWSTDLSHDEGAFARFISAFMGSFLFLLMAIPVFFLVSSPKLALKFVQWISTAAISPNIFSTVIAICLFFPMGLAGVFGFFVSGSVPRDLTLSEIFMKSLTLTIRFVTSIAILLLILMSVRTLVMDIFSQG